MDYKESESLQEKRNFKRHATLQKQSFTMKFYAAIATVGLFTGAFAASTSETTTDPESAAKAPASPYMVGIRISVIVQDVRLYGLDTCSGPLGSILRLAALEFACHRAVAPNCPLVSHLR